MIIKNLNLRSFGKFKNKNIEFEDGFNVVYGKNEAGKSTISTAIKTFFYPDITVKKKYKRNCVPIGEAKGSFDITVKTDDNEVYESYITLGKTNGRTLVKTVKKPLDEDAGSSDTPMGEFFFGLEEELFDSVFYIKDLESYKNITESREDVSGTLAKLGNNVIDIDITKVLDDIKGELNAYVRKTSSGKIYPLNEKLAQIEKDLYYLERVRDSVKNADEKIDNIKSTISKNQEFITTLYEERKKSEIYGEYIKAKEQISLREKISELKNKIETEEVESPSITVEELEFIKEYKPGDKKGINILYPVLFAVVFAASVIGGIFNPYLLNGIWASLIFAVLFGIDMKKSKGVKEEIKKYNDILTEYNITGYDDYNNKIKEKEVKEYEKRILLSEINHLNEKLCEYNPEYANMNVEKPMYTEKEIDESISKISSDINNLKIEEVKISENKKNAFNNLPDYEALLKEKEELNEKISGLYEEHEIAEDAYRILEETKESFKASYLPFLQERTKEILKGISGEEFDYFGIKEDFGCEIRRSSEAEIKDSDYLSRGTLDMVNFALRLAIYELICDNYSVPLILDDCFIELDDERFEKMIAYLISNFKHQIIYFTAHKRIFNLPLEKCTVIDI